MAILLMRFNSEYPYQFVMISLFKLANAKFYSIRQIFKIFRLQNFILVSYFSAWGIFISLFFFTEYFQILISEFFLFLL